jgi:hypothetical protein
VALQHSYLALRQLPRNKNQAFLCIRSLVTTIFDSWYGLWLLRNSHLHSTLDHNLHSFCRLQLLHEILYDSAPTMLRHDRQIFRHEFDSFADAPVRTLLSFVKFAKPIVKRSKKQTVTLGPNSRSITDYFDYVPPEFPPHMWSQRSSALPADADTIRPNWSPTRQPPAARAVPPFPPPPFVGLRVCPTATPRIRVVPSSHRSETSGMALWQLDKQ